ncbi:uncharacterized protein LOC128987135 isoform X2 [Macrosteles quadrilineatus]|nr:uncharacterized protein LOC128987135 isoform X2 [Macrosteles quadrilineatus]
MEWTSHNQLSRVDYIVIVLDPRESTCITTAEDNISKIDSTYIEAGRLCFVNGACGMRPADMGISLGHINVMSQKYSVMLINGDVLNAEKCLHLSSSIVRLVSIVIGVQTGVPMSVDIPGYFS